MLFSKTGSLCIIALAALIPTAPALAQEASETVQLAEDESASPDENNTIALNLAEQIVNLGYPEDTREQLFFGTMDQTIVQLRQSLSGFLPQDDPEAVKIFDDWIAKYSAESKDILRKHIPTIMGGMTEAYADLFSEEELRDILAFVQTPSGKQFFDRMPDVIGSASFADANQAYMDESMASMIPAQRELLQQLKTHQENKADPAETT
ncbi:DUF2059 domain-containing protein [Erythrobacter sp. F6033]|uniref:DUF2059 domain-containing protein n=1 Tax=Erythrobacter sp. F6033 TaxID=2926401 RepID=UPI001FF5B70E|nr:DUF2059 domain-containing protein [Erythrobacter sp. F6033]MCK0128469.1 DUF2059 domain-containing protein [Erythrobacter sp. F6033]